MPLNASKALPITPNPVVLLAVYQEETTSNSKHGAPAEHLERLEPLRKKPPQPHHQNTWTDMDDGYAGTGAAPLLQGAGVAFLPAVADDDVVHTTTTVVRSASYITGGVGFATGGAAARSPSEASAFAEAALDASFFSIPPEHVGDRGRRGESQDRHQPERHHAVYGALPRASSGWTGEGSSSRSREGGDCGWSPRPHKEEELPRQAAHQGYENQEGRGQQQAVGVDDGCAGVGSHGSDGVSKKRKAGFHALEQELLERARISNRARNSSATVPPLPMGYGAAGFTPRSRGLAHRPQQDASHSSHNAMVESVPTSSPGDLAGVVPVYGGGPQQPTTAVRRRHRGSSTQEEKPNLPATISDQQEDHRPDGKETAFETRQQISRRRAGAAGRAKIPKTRKRDVAARCQHSGCSQRSSFGPKSGPRKATNCAAHKREGMVKIASRKCANDMCSTAPSYGFQGKRATFCSKHKAPGTINVVTPRCQRDGCDSCASYGHMAERRPLFCARHAQDGMCNVVSRKCLGVGCLKNPSYGHPGDRRASFCVDHHLAGMSNIVSPKCLAPGCGKAPSFGQHGDPKATWCKSHKKNEMVNLLYSRQLQKCGM